MTTIVHRLGCKSTAVILILALTAGCAQTRGGPISYNVASFGLPDPTEPASLSDDLTLAPGDKLEINVFRVPDLTHEYTVDLAGNVSMPLIGSVGAVGKTSAALADEIGKRLSQRYLNDPHVSVALIQSSGRKITIDGAVKEPGAFPVTSKMTLLQAVAMGKGPDESANPKRVAIFRRINGQRMAAAFDLTSIRRGQSPDPEVFAGDVVVVDGTRTRTLLNQAIGILPILSLFKPY